MTSFTPPLRVGDKPLDNYGQVQLVQQATVTFETAADTVIGEIPADGYALDVFYDVTTAFNAATTNTLQVDTAAGNITNAADVGTAGRVTTTIDSAEIGPYAASTPVRATYAQTGAAATAGSAVVTIVYVVNRILPA